ncbi:hypothetical protein Pint_22628 [Pistacia integerrima]|uniref:Uncharacterized protein n=1 Tax=Pistacia integerrima TaxID=434235 RepID=A0ACC0YJU4_9ROSI|nr:hypothetical protein Pint_22628 [Pistacia integerrima]
MQTKTRIKAYYVLKVKDSNTCTNSKKNKDNILCASGPPPPKIPCLFSSPFHRSASPFCNAQDNGMLYYSSPILPSALVFQECNVVLLLSHFAIVFVWPSCPRLRCHPLYYFAALSLVILCYASFAYCRPALHVIYHYPPQEEPPCPRGGKREIEY